MPPKRDRRKQHHTHHYDPSDDTETALLKSQLESLNLTLKEITGDGNCLFRALSDQYNGSPQSHSTQRSLVCSHLLANRPYFEPFLSEWDASSFDKHVHNMSQDGTYGGNMEIVAFAQLKKVDICVYWGGGCYIVRGGDVPSDKVLHIAYHSWEHYSSVRNVDGPMNGLPEIKIIPSAMENKSKNDGPPNSIEKMVMRSTNCDDINKVREALKRHHGNANAAIDSLYEQLHGDGDNDGPETLVGDTAAAAAAAETLKVPSEGIGPREENEKKRKSTENDVVMESKIETKAENRHAPNSKGGKAARGPSGREKKEMKKRLQKENRRQKHVNSTQSPADRPVNGLVANMKVMEI